MLMCSTTMQKIILGGILVFDLPDIPQQGGHHVRVFRNKSINNNTDNFAPEEI